MMAGKQIKHGRITQVRRWIQSGMSLIQLTNMIESNYGVSRQTARQYIDEAAAPFRAKYEATKAMNQRATKWTHSRKHDN